MNNLTSNPHVSSLLRQRLAPALVVVYVLVQVGMEFYRSAPVSGELLGKFSWRWAGGYLVFAGGLALLLILSLLLLFKSQRVSRLYESIAAWRQQLPALMRFAAILAAVLPPAALLLPWVKLPATFEALLSGPYIRLFVCLAAAGTIGFHFTREANKLIGLAPFLYGLVIVGSVFLVFERLGHIHNYPFTQTWSEGNRMFEFSLRIALDQYTLVGPPSPRNAGAGREFLWGIPFLISGLPIWVHRLWDAILWIVPGLALGYSLARRTALSSTGRWILTGWIFIFLSQGPIYAPIVLSAVVVSLWVWPSRRIFSLAAAPAAGYLATASRWTWLFAPAAWAGMLLLEDFILRPEENIRQTIKRLMPIVLVVFSGLAGGLLAYAILFPPSKLVSEVAFSQPLLWYRLLPNTIFPEGILLALVLATGPVCTLLVWLALTRRWVLNWVQTLAYSGISLVFLSTGVVISVKIGGGSNLHNLDMFLITIAILAMMALRHVELSKVNAWPIWMRGLLVLACLFPSWKAARYSKPATLPESAVVAESLHVINSRISRAQKRGEVLFIDQRQLLIFGDLDPIPVVTAYEKRYMMDKAMANDSVYFRQFYRDLADKRFSLIIVEPLYDNLQSEGFDFQEENNAWVNWVSKPLLCFYAPVETLGKVRTQMLTPKNDTKKCSEYLMP